MFKLLLLGLAGYTLNFTLVATTEPHSHPAPEAPALHFHTHPPSAVHVHPPAIAPAGCRVLDEARLSERSPPRIVLRCDDPVEVARFKAALGPPTAGACWHHCSWGHDVHLIVHDTRTENYTTIELRWPLTRP